LIDLSPDELLKRLADGKVYTKDKTAAAIGNFFREGNLTALREIALRKTAERVDLQLKDYMQEHQISGPWKAAERLMVAVGPSPYSEQLIRWTRRIAANLEASWVVVYVKTSQPLSDEAEERLKKNIALAQELGATLVTTTGDDVVSALIRTARQNNVTQIVIGKSMTNPLVDFLHGGSLVNRLIRESGGIDIYVVKSDSTAPEKKRFQFIPPPSLRSPVRHYALSCGAIIAAALACYAVLPVVDYRSIGMVLLFVVSLLSLSVGRGPILAAAALGAVVWDFFFIPPHFTFSISYPADWLVLLLYFIVALVTGTLTSRARIHERAVRDRESDATSFYAMVGELSSAETVRDVVALAGVHLGSFFNAEVTFYSTGPSEKDLPRQPHPLSGFKPDSDKEWSVAEWVFENRKPAGLGTKTLPFAKATYYPLLTQGGCIGVVGFVPHNKRSFTFKNEILLQMFLHQIALAIERIHLRSDRLGKTLLNSISHELRTPLTTITTAATALLDRTTMANQAALDMCITDINTASARLNRLVDNLLDMTRIESGSLQIHREWCDVADLFASVVKNYRPELGNRIVELSVPADMPLVNVDAVLIEQAIANIVLNAAQYTPENKRIILSARHEAGSIILSVEDEGPGVPQESVGRIFDKFYRLPGTVSGGTGLGLSIVKGFIEAHDGAVDARNRDGGGMQFVIRLPTTQAPSTAALEIRTMHDQGTDGIL
jgi:two-component system sensor histidine kinase KdpD